MSSAKWQPFVDPWEKSLKAFKSRYKYFTNILYPENPLNSLRQSNAYMRQ